MAFKIDRARYASLYGPTTGDRVRLGDTSLILEVEKDYTTYGDEACFGGGKVLRDGLGVQSDCSQAESLDLVITNCLVIDYTGIYKADIGVKDGLIAGIGKAGNPDVMANVTPGMNCGATTEAMAGEGMILTAGGLDVHVHFICPQLYEEAISAGLTTLMGGGTGPTSGTNATTCTPGSHHIRMMLQAVDDMPMNFGFWAKGNSSHPDGLSEQIVGGAAGFKLHEDWGTTPAAIDSCLTVADDYDVQVCIHTDTLNESGYVEDSIAAFKGRTIHTYHTEGAGGGHAPDIIKVCGEPNVIPSSTNPTRPYTKNTIDEHLDMLMVCHHLNPDLPEDVQFAESRIRKETIAAEDVLHDLGALSIYSSDSQAMGRIGEVISRCWQTASKMKDQRGALPQDSERNDNFRIKRYLSKYTINPAIAQGISTNVGSIEKGKMADLVLWSPDNFGAKPEMIFKAGVVAWANMGDANASIPTTQPALLRPMFAAKGRASAGVSLAFVSMAAIHSRGVEGYGLSSRLAPVRNTRNIGKKDMKFNDTTPKIEVDPETFLVHADGQLMMCDPADRLPLTQRYYFF